jgi:hypothetical protein
MMRGIWSLSRRAVTQGEAMFSKASDLSKAVAMTFTWRTSALRAFSKTFIHSFLFSTRKPSTRFIDSTLRRHYIIKPKISRTPPHERVARWH